MFTIENLPSSPAPLIYLPGPSRSSRNVHSKSRGSCRPSVVVHNCEVMCESGTERDAALIMATDPDVVELREQPPAVTWVDAEGRHLNALRADWPRDTAPIYDGLPSQPCAGKWPRLPAKLSASRSRLSTSATRSTKARVFAGRRVHDA